ncbi:MAG: hypothetical protein EPO10_01520 [Reyranella sp.]|uniref:hypothetical protein n=1 Tax=Reyranella sp. TaxID=1929291 RepID=UPI001213DB8B|nr:hypothetical protein [Reyranella sp.]TAJ92045.1 MAG: hypothetical protein EPO41_14110 [Reyranella sp.]TBR30699.1 MAG: hypothetical protein EPO10_01520 [Reyranella sp.]
MSSFKLSSFMILPLVAGQALMTSACGVPTAVSAASYAADGGLLAASDKTSTDHVYSVVTKQDCAIWRIFKGRQICTARVDGKDPYNTDYTEPQRTVSESGVEYSAPLRPAANAPAVSWDSSVYRAPSATPPAAEGPMTANVEPAAESAPPTKAAAPPKTKKAKTAQRSAKKPSRGPAASVP